jgi:hypothetical protein
MFSPRVEKSLLTGEWTEESAAEWDADDDPIVAEVRRHRQEILAEYDFDMDRYLAALNVIGYACGRKYVSYDWRDPHGPREPELPADLTGLIPNREKFIGEVRRDRTVAATREPDLEAYNEDARRRALVLGFPAETFVVTAEEVKVIADRPRYPWRYDTREPRDDD